MLPAINIRQERRVYRYSGRLRIYHHCKSAGQVALVAVRIRGRRREAVNAVRQCSGKEIPGASGVRFGQAEQTCSVEQAHDAGRRSRSAQP